MSLDEPDASVEGDDHVIEATPKRRSLLTSLMAPRSSDPLTDGEVRGQMRTLDPRERRYGFILAPLGLLVAVIQLVELTTTVVLKKPRDGSCSFFHGSTLVKKSCQLLVKTHPTDYHLVFALGLVLCALLFVATWRSMRTLVTFTSLFIGLFAGLPGLLFLAYGGWLVWRAWQLQRRGTKDSKELGRLSAERSAERVAARRERRAGASSTETATARTQAQASKRYTPKAKPRRR